MFLPIAFILIGILFFYIGISGISKWNEKGSGIFVIILGILSLAISTLCLLNENFNRKKSTIYVKPEIQILEKTNKHIRLLIDNRKIIEKDTIEWLNTNNIYWKLDHYKNRTNVTLMVKDK